MITKQHTALYFLALTAKRKEGDSYVKCYEELHEGLAWVLLPDAIRAYIGPRQAGHFEKLPNGTDTSWMKYPAPEVLKSLTKESAQSEIKFHLADGYPKCVIGEQTDVGLFDQKNWNHKFYHELRIHMLQDYMLVLTQLTIMAHTGLKRKKYLMISMVSQQRMSLLLQ